MTGILAVETATDACSVAVHAQGATRERHVVAPRQHSALLFGLLEELVPGGDLPGQGIDVVAYGSGPGSFTGLRIAASVAQGLAYSSRLPAVAVPTLECLALGALRAGVVTLEEPVVTVLDARVNEIYAAVYTFAGELPALVAGPWVGPPGEYDPAFAGKFTVVGSGCRYRDRFSSSLSDRLQGSAPDLLPRASDMIPLARARVERGELQAPVDVQPVYVRDEIHWKKVGEQGRHS
jgi:tRNA threonylcarbamoyladenosine biosynthesis protein TsaB